MLYEPIKVLASHASRARSHYMAGIIIYEHPIMPLPLSHCNHRMRLATRSLHSHKSGVTHAVTRLVTRLSRGHPRPLRSFALIGIFSFYSAFRVVSTQRLVLLCIVHFINRLHSHVTRRSPGGHAVTILPQTSFVFMEAFAFHQNTA